MLSRRTLLTGPPAAALLTPAAAETAPHRPRIAALVTEYRKHSHGQHVVDRFLEGYAWEGEHRTPAVDVASLYVDQVGANDLSAERLRRHSQVRRAASIEDALTLGTGTLAVDGVLLIGEHGHYPTNERGQIQYPRCEFFREVVKVFRRSGRAVPVFNDKHLSWRWDWAKEMSDTAHELGFALMAGSSLAVSRRIPSVELPSGAEVEEVLCVGDGGMDSYDFHAMEAIQCLVERRRGGETGVTALQAYTGEAVWRAHAAGSWEAGGWDPRLFEACLCRSHQLTPARAGFNHVYPRPEDLPRLVKKPLAYRYEYGDGLRATILLVPGLVEPFSAALRIKGRREPWSCNFYLPISPGGLINFFNPLVRHIETLFLTGRAPYPLDRTLLTTGLTEAGVESVHRGGKRIETPHLALAYRAPRASTFWRG